MTRGRAALAAGMVAMLALAYLLRAWLQPMEPARAEPSAPPAVQEQVIVEGSVSPRAAELATPVEARREIEPPAGAGAGAGWTVRVLRGGRPAASVDVGWVLPQARRESRRDPSLRELDWFQREWSRAERAVTDAQGEAWIPVLPADARLLAQSGREFAYRIVVANDTPPFVLHLDADSSLRVRVRDASGQPRAGIPLRVSLQAGASTHVIPAETDVDGIAAYPHVLLGKQLSSKPEQGVAFVEALFGSRAEAAFSCDPFPAEPVELQLPAHGAVLIEVVDQTGAPLDVAQPVRLARRDPTGASRWNEGRDPSAAVTSGRARFALVGLDLDLEATLDGRPERGIEVVRFQGPRVEGEERVARMLLRSVPKVRVRVLESGGAPLVKRALEVQKVQLFASGSSFHGSERAQTDGSGFVEIAIPEVWSEGMTLMLTLRHAPGSLESPQEANLDLSRTLPPGTSDLGEVRLREPAVLASGRVLDTRGAGVEGARATVQWLYSKEQGEERWFDLAHAYTREDGRFMLHQGDATPAQDLRLSVTSRSHLPADPLPISPGRRDLEVVLRQGGSLVGSVRLPEGLAARAFQLEALSPGGALLRSLDLQADGGFVIEGLAPGSVAVHVILACTQERVARVEDVQVVEGERRADPRLQDLELGHLARLSIRVHLASGKPADAGWVRLLSRPTSGPHGAAFASAFVIESGEAHVFAQALPVDLEIRVPGHRVLALSAVKSDQEVTLERAFRIRIALPPAFELPPATCKLRVQLVPVIEGHPAPQFLTLYKQATPAGQWHAAFSSTDNDFGPQREVELEVQQPGPHQVLFMLHQGGTGGSQTSSEVSPSPPQVLELTPADAGRVFEAAPDAKAHASFR